LSVLVVGDDRDFLAHVQAEFRARRGVEVRTADGMAAAVAAVRGLPPDLTLVDLDFASRERVDPLEHLFDGQPPYPVLGFVSTIVQEREAYARGADIVLRRPCPLERIREAVADGLTLARCARVLRM